MSLPAAAIVSSAPLTGKRRTGSAAFRRPSFSFVDLPDGQTFARSPSEPMPSSQTLRQTGVFRAHGIKDFYFPSNSLPASSDRP